MRMSMKLSLSHLPIMIDNFSIFNISFTQAVEYCIISPIFVYFKNVDFLSALRNSKHVAPRMNYFTKKLISLRMSQKNISLEASLWNIWKTKTRKRRIDKIAFFIDISGIDRARSMILQFSK